MWKRVKEFEKLTGVKNHKLRRKLMLYGGGKRKHIKQSGSSSKRREFVGQDYTTPGTSLHEYACETDANGAYTGRKIIVTDCEGNGVMVNREGRTKEMRYRRSDRGSVCEDSEAALDCNPADRLAAFQSLYQNPKDMTFGDVKIPFLLDKKNIDRIKAILAVDGMKLKDLPNKMRQNMDLCLIAVKSNGLALQYVFPKDRRGVWQGSNSMFVRPTQEQRSTLISVAFEQNPASMQYHRKLWSDEQIMDWQKKEKDRIYHEVTQNGRLLEHLVPDLFTPDMIHAALRNDGTAIEFIRKRPLQFNELKDYFKVAIGNTPVAGTWIPYLWKYPISNEQLIQTYQELFAIHKLIPLTDAGIHRRNENMIAFGWLQEMRDLSHVWQLENQAEVTRWIQQDGRVFKQVIDELKTKENTLAAIRTWPDAVQHVLRSNGEYIQFGKDEAEYFIAAAKLDYRTARHLPQFSNPTQARITGKNVFIIMNMLKELVQINGMVLRFESIQEIVENTFNLQQRLSNETYNVWGRIQLYGYRNSDMFDIIHLAVKNDGMALQYAKKYRYEELIYEAARQQNEDSRKWGPCEGYKREPHMPFEALEEGDETTDHEDYFEHSLENREIWDEQVRNHNFPANYNGENKYYCLPCFRNWLKEEKGVLLCMACNRPEHGPAKMYKKVHIDDAGDHKLKDDDVDCNETDCELRWDFRQFRECETTKKKVEWHDEEVAVADIPLCDLCNSIQKCDHCGVQWIAENGAGFWLLDNLDDVDDFYKLDDGPSNEPPWGGIWKEGETNTEWGDEKINFVRAKSWDGKKKIVCDQCFVKHYYCARCHSNNKNRGAETEDFEDPTGVLSLSRHPYHERPVCRECYDDLLQEIEEKKQNEEMEDVDRYRAALLDSETIPTEDDIHPTDTASFHLVESKETEEERLNRIRDMYPSDDDDLFAEDSEAEEIDYPSGEDY